MRVRFLGFAGWQDVTAEVGESVGQDLEWAVAQAERSVHDNETHMRPKSIAGRQSYSLFWEQFPSGQGGLHDFRFDRAHGDNGSQDRRRRFLVVDYNKDFVETLRVLLELNGHYVDVAFDGLAGLEAAIRTEPDVVVLDLGLPKLNGYEVSHRIQEQRLATQPLIIAPRAGRSLSIVRWVSTQGSTRT